MKKIKQIYSQPASPWTNGCIERCWKTIKGAIYKHQIISGRKGWVKILSAVTDNYNCSYHRSINTTPNEAGLISQKLLAKKLHQNGVQIDNKPTMTYKIGDKVRLLIRADTKEKGKQYITSELFFITKVIKGTLKSRTHYKVVDSNGNIKKGTFNATDLLCANSSEDFKITQDSKYRPPLPIRGQVEVDRLLKDKNLRPAAVRGEYVVERILDMRTQLGEKLYHVKWSGYPVEETTWFAESNLKNAKDAIKDFLKNRTSKKSVKVVIKRRK
jgi:hypothetical protein